MRGGRISTANVRTIANTGNCHTCHMDGLTNTQVGEFDKEVLTMRIAVWS